ncbi:MAG: MarR family transcriptional regulator [Eggerthellaceae bacterium]|jgi:DNA-binding MarR family transcriptional regulator
MLASAGHTDWITVSVLLSRSASDAVTRMGGISITQYRVLIRLIMAPDGMTVSAIADELAHSKSAVTIALNGLERKKAVTRAYDSADKRVVTVRVTDAGRDLVARIDPAVKQVAHEFWSCYTDEELELTYRDSGATAENFNLAYRKDGSMSIENAYVDASWVIVFAITQQLKRANISLNEYRLLYLLYETPDGMRPSDAARRLLLWSNEVATTSSKLEQHGRIVRTRNDTDRRSCTLTITPSGVDKLKRITPGVVETLRSSIVDLPAGAFDRYEAIARKVLSANRALHLMG